MARLALVFALFAAAAVVASAQWTFLGADITVVDVQGSFVIAAALNEDLENVTTIFDCSSAPPCTVVRQLSVPTATTEPSTYAVPKSVDRVNAGQFRILVESLDETTSSPFPPYEFYYYYYELYICTVAKDGWSISCEYEWDPIEHSSTIFETYSGAVVAGYAEGNSGFVVIYLCGLSGTPTSCTYEAAVLPSPETYLDSNPSMQLLRGGTLFIMPTDLQPRGFLIYDCTNLFTTFECSEPQRIASLSAEPNDGIGGWDYEALDAAEPEAGGALYFGAPGYQGIVGQSGRVCVFLCSGASDNFRCTNDTIECWEGPLTGCTNGTCGFGGNNRVAATFNNFYVGAPDDMNGKGSVTVFNCSSLVLCDPQYSTNPESPGIGDNFGGTAVRTSYELLAVTTDAGYSWVTPLALPRISLEQKRTAFAGAFNVARALGMF